MKFLSREDVPIIEGILSRGNDVSIQCTPNGYRILEKTVKVKAKRDVKSKNTLPSNGTAGKAKWPGDV